MIGYDGRVNLTDKPKRESPPKSWKRTIPDQTTFHHNIAWERLGILWNCLVDQKRWKSLALFTVLLGQKDTEAVKFVEGLSRGDMDADQRTDIGNHLLWSGWNIVEGPLGSDRLDDPGSRFDAFVNGLPLGTETRFSNIRIFNAVVEGFIAQFESHQHGVQEGRGADCHACAMTAMDLDVEFQIVSRAHGDEGPIFMSKAVANVILDVKSGKSLPANVDVGKEMWRVVPQAQRKGNKIWRKAG